MRFNHFFSFLAALTTVCSLNACVSRPVAPLAAPPPYERHIVLVVETSGFHPVAGATIKVLSDPPSALVLPADGQGQTGTQGELKLVFKPMPNYDRSVWANGEGDVLVDYPVKAKLIINYRGRTVERFLDDMETYARFKDPLYQGVNRDPAVGITYYGVTLP